MAGRAKRDQIFLNASAPWFARSAKALRQELTGDELMPSFEMNPLPFGIGRAVEGHGL